MIAVKQIDEKFQSLKKYFLTKSKKKPTGSAGEDKDNWIYYKSLEFLLSVSSQRPSVTNVSKE